MGLEIPKVAEIGPKMQQVVKEFAAEQQAKRARGIFHGCTRISAGSGETARCLRASSL